MNFLIPETLEVTGKSWYSPLAFIKEHRNVVGAWLVDTASSAGDWSGIVAIRQSATDGDVKLYEFCQEIIDPFSGPNYRVSFEYIGDTLLPVTEDKALEYYSHAA